MKIQTGRGTIPLITLIAIWSISALTSLPGLAVSPILGDLTKIFPKATDLDIQMLTSLPSLLIIPFILLGGKLTEKVDFVRILKIGLWLFAASGILYLISNKMWQLIVVSALLGIGFTGFTVNINDRRILRGMLESMGFAADTLDSVCITFDKMDKIGLEGVEAELLENGFDKTCVDKYLELFKGLESAEDGVAYLADTLEGFLEPEIAQSLREIMDSVKATKASDFEIVFDATLVRGMSYYTGTIFEIAMPEFGGSCGGGGRYDKMVGKFTGNDVPACGFSIGFERIIMLLMERGFKVPTRPKQVAYLIEKGVSGERLCEVIAQAQEARKDGTQVLVARMNKNKKFQKEQLNKEGYEEFVEFYKEELKR
mgnify:CR=1 FL=1